jgi:rod shape-determining protein MreB
MGLFNFFTQEIAMDLGTANTLIIHNDDVVVNEPSIVALNRNNMKEVLAVGKKALMMHEKTHESIRTIRPLKDGVIADFNAAELMIRELMKMIYPKKPLFPPSWRMVICIPSSITEVEKRAVRDSAEQAGAKEVYMIHEPMAAALGIGIDVEEPVGNMIIDIGGGTTGITVIALAGIVCDQSIRIAGDEFTADIMEALRRYHSLLIGERTAEQIKINVGAAMKDLDNPPEDMPVNGRDLVTGIPKQIMVSYQEIAEALDKSIFKIEEAILKALETTPPELAADIYRRGLYLTGGGALLRGLDKRLSAKIKLPVHVADDPLKSVVRGTGLALKNYQRFPFIMSKVMSLLHHNSGVSAMLQKSKSSGDIFWDGNDPHFVTMRKVSKSANVKIGDTVVTSTYSSNYPSGIMIGTVVEVKPDPAASFNNLKLKTSTNFFNIQYVYVIKNTRHDEQTSLSNKKDAKQP